MTPATSNNADGQQVSSTDRKPEDILNSRGTTYLDGPQTEAGLVDYAAALRQKWREQLIPDNNAAISLLAGTWPPRRLSETEIEVLRQDLNWQTPVEGELQGGYSDESLAQVEAWLASKEVGVETSADHEAAVKMIFEARRAPWDLSTFPPMKKWLDDEQRIIERFHSALDRTRFYCPSTTSLQNPNSPLAFADYLHPRLLRTATDLLGLEAMYFIGKGDRENAWRNIETMFHLSSLGMDCNPEEFGARIAMRARAIHCTLALITKCECSRELLSQIESCRQRQVTFRRSLNDLVFNQRLATLDLAQRIYLREPIDDSGRFEQMLGWLHHSKALDHDFDPNVMLARINRWFDDVERSASENDRSADQSQLFGLANRIPAQLTSPLGHGEDFAKASPKELGIGMADYIISYTLPQEQLVLRMLADRYDTMTDMLFVAIELEKYKSEHHQYPSRLAELGDLADKKLLKDPFSDDDLRYERRGDGYLLYSVLFQGDNGGDGGDGITGEIVDGEWELDYVANGIGGDAVFRLPIPAFRSPDQIRFPKVE